MSEDNPTLSDNEPNPSQGHKPRVHARARAMHYGSIERVLLFLSKTDLHALRFCTPETRMTQSSVGAMVAITGCFAFISGYFALSSTFFAGGSSVAAILIPCLIAAFYATAIMTFDREVVAADKGLLGSVARVVLATFIGLVISFPIETKLLEDAIRTQYEKNVAELSQPMIEEQTELRQMRKQEREDELASYRDKVGLLKARAANALDEWDRERHRVTCAARCMQRKDEMDIANAQLSEAQQELREKMKVVDAELDARFAEQAKRIKDIDAAIQAKGKSGKDFLTRANVLHQLTQESTMAFWVSWLLRIFFVMLELFPVIIKLSLPYNEYHAYLRSRRALNVNRQHVITNDYNRKIKENPGLARNAGEITDVLEMAMEDRVIDIHGHDVEDAPGTDRDGRSPVV